MSNTNPEQPYEGIEPLPADQVPFMLEDCTLLLRLLVRHLAYDLSSACLGHAGSRYRDTYRRMTDPQPGDLVIERSTIYRDDITTVLGGFGFLLAKRLEWATTDAEWALECSRSDAEHRGMGLDPLTPEEHVEHRSRETAWYIQYGPERAHIFRWVNAECLALPVTAEQIASTPKRVWQTPDSA